jgi:phosphoserine phosphatase RsbU/P
MPTFIITRGTETGRRFEFREDIEIGRAPQLAFSINDRGISRRHAGVSVRNGVVTVSDLGSQNGTIVNGQLIRAATLLKDGDEVRVGGVWLKFQQEVEKPDAESSSVQLDDKPQGVIRSITAVDAGAPLADEGDEKPTVETLSKRLKLLYDVSVAIHQVLDEETLFALILRKLFEVFPSADRGFILILNPAKNELKPAAVLARPGMSGQIGISRELVWNVVRNRQGIVSVDAMLDGRFQESHSIVAMGLHAVVCVPMMADDEVHGVLAIDSLRSSGAFGKDDMALLVGIAAQAALALTKARLHRQLVGREILERDLALAKKIQARFLPRGEPDPPGWTFQAHYASAFEIGGDFYDFIDLPGNHLAVVIGDVSGKGVAAALYMVKIST